MAKNIFDVQSALNSVSHVPRNSIISLVIDRILFEFINAKHNSIARLEFNRKVNKFLNIYIWFYYRLIDTSASLRHSTIVDRCLCTAL